MERLIKNITEKDKFTHIITDFCNENICHLKIADKNIEITLEKIENNNLYIKTTKVYIDCNTCFITNKKGNTLITVFCKYIDSPEKYVYILEPLRIQFYNTKREEDRNLFVDYDVTEKHYLTDFISEINLRQKIEDSHEQIDKIINVFQEDFYEYFDNVDISLVNRFKDIRMKFIHQNLSPIFIADFNKEIDSKIASRYKEEVIDIDSTIKSNAYVSEILYPLIYNGIILLGYIQINKRFPFKENEYKLVEKKANDLVLKLESVLNITLQKEKYNLTDISQSGLSIITKNTNDIDLFEVDHFIYGFLVLENESKKVLLLVKNINVSPEGYIRVGCKIASVLD